MKHFLKASVIFTVMTFQAMQAADMSDKEVIALINKVTVKVTGGDVSALDDLNALPPNSEVPALLMYYRQNKFVFRHTPQNQAITAKTSKMVEATPGADTYLKGLFKKPEVANPPNWIFKQRAAAIACLVQLNDKFAIRTLAESMFDTEAPGVIATGLADMNIQGAPYSTASRKDSGSPAAVAKWQDWWTTNKALYQ